MKDLRRNIKDLRSDFINYISRGFEKDFRNYELYLLLAEYYNSFNKNQAYICLKQAMFYCENPQAGENIASQIKALESEISVRKTSVIILSYNTKDITQMCLDGLFSNCNSEDTEVVVVDNASTDESVEMLQNYPQIKLIVNTENRGFAGGCNDGIAAANSENDILLLNSDALLLPNSLFWLKMGLYEANDVGCTGSITNYSGNDQSVPMDDSDFDAIMNFAQTTNVPMECPYVQKIFLVAFSMLIKKEVMDKIGVLDERFNPGNFEDTDYGMRVATAGYKSLMCRNSFVYHFGSKSFKKADSDYASILENNLRKFIDKWGFDVRDYTNVRADLADLIERDVYDEFNVLEVGCGCGGTIGYLEGKFPNAHFDGIEINEKVADFGGLLFNIVQDSLESPQRTYETELYDYIILGEVAEQAYNPSEALKRAYGLLKPNGCVIACIPNIMHISVLSQLLSGRFDYEEGGILDRSHIRFFTLKTMMELFSKTGFSIKHVSAAPANGNFDEEIDKIMTVAGADIERIQFEAYQYYLIAQRPE